MVGVARHSRNRKAPVKLSAAELDQYREILDETSALLKPLLSGAKTVVSETFLAHGHSGIPAYVGTIGAGREMSGAELFTYVRKRDPLYSAFVREEDELLEAAVPQLSQILHNDKLCHVSLGPGTEMPVIERDYLFAKTAFNAPRYIAVDRQLHLARGAARTLKVQMTNYGNRSIPTESYASDFTTNFTQDWPPAYTAERSTPLIATMFGGTMGQFNMPTFFENFFRVTKGRALLLFSLNCSGEHPETPYTGPIWAEFRRYLPQLLKKVSGDSSFNPEAALHQAYTDDGKVVHSYSFIRDTCLTVGDVAYPIPENTRVIIGFSNRPKPNAIPGIAEGAGMQEIRRYNIPGKDTYLFLVGPAALAKELRL